LSHDSTLGTLSRLSAESLGVFRGQAAVALGVSRKQFTALIEAGVVERVLPDTYRVTAVPRFREQALRAALLCAGDDAAAAGRSGGALFALEGVRAARPEIVVPRRTRMRLGHDDPVDYEHDNDKWSVPGRRGYRLVFATWAKVERAPHELISELRATLAA